MRPLLASIALACACATSAHAQIGIGVTWPGVSIGVRLPLYPELVPVPGYPVYYAPGLSLNFFFYDGLYWVYRGDHWYRSAWYNGPWTQVAPLYVPVYLLRVPVRYYRVPPPYFRPWRPDRPPRWGEYWGDDWQRQRRGWDVWDHRAVPPRAPLPVHQRQYAGERYPYQVERQQALNDQNYRYQPKDPVVREQVRIEPVRAGPPGRGDRADRGSPDKDDRADRDAKASPRPPQAKGPPPGKGHDDERGQSGRPR